MNATRSQQALAWGLLAAGLIASGAGSLWNLYSEIFWYDEVVHGYNFFALALTLVVAVYVYGTVLTGADGHGLLLVLAVVGLARPGCAVGDRGVDLRPVREAERHISQDGHYRGPDRGRRRSPGGRDSTLEDAPQMNLEPWQTQYSVCEDVKISQ